MNIYYTVPEIWHVTYVIIIFHFGLFFALLLPLPPLIAQKIKILKKWKKCLDIIILQYICVPKIMIRSYTVPEIWCMMDRWTDGWKKWHIEVGALPKKTISVNVKADVKQQEMKELESVWNNDLQSVFADQMYKSSGHFSFDSGENIRTKLCFYLN